MNRLKLIREIEKELEKKCLSILDLKNILDDIKEMRPITLKEYINDKYSEYNREILNEIEKEATEIFIVNSEDEMFKSDGYINHWSELKINGDIIDIYIAENYDFIINPYDLSEIVYKLWANEIVLSK